ncbi:MAG: hypothetical protein U1E53_15925 [Dongiaceae bacterium]
MRDLRGRTCASRAAAWGWRALAVGLLALAGAVVAAPRPAQATVVCGNPDNTTQEVKLKDLKRSPGEDLQVVGNCIVEGGLLSNPSPEYKFGKVNIFSKKPDKCRLDGFLTGNFLTPTPCGGKLTFKDERIDFWASSIVVERGGALVAGSPTAPIGTTGRGEDQTSRHVLTITLWGPGNSLATNVPGVGCVTPATATTTFCGIPTDTWNNGATTPQPIPGVAGADYFYKYDALPFDSSGYYGNKVLGVGFGGRLQLYGKKGATYATTPLPLDSGTSWVRLAANLAKGGKAVTLDRAVDWEKGDSVVVTGTDYLPAHFDERKIDAMGQDKMSFETVQGMDYPHNGKRYVLQGVVPSELGIDPKLIKNGAETRAAVALLSRSIVIRSGGDKLGDLLCADVGCYYGGHTVIRQGVLAAQIQGVEFALLGQGGRLGTYPVHFHMIRHAPAGTMVADSSINESMTRWITLHGTQDVLFARNVGYKSIGHGFYLEDGSEVNNKLYSNLGIFARAAVVGWPDAQLKGNDPNWRKVPGILAQRFQIGPDFVPPFEGPEEADRFPFHSDWNHPSVFWIMNAWNDFQGNMASGAGMCGACYWLVPAANSGHSQMMSWVGYASRQKQTDPPMSNTGPDLSRAASTPLKSFTGNYCSSAEFSFITISKTENCRGFGSVSANRLQPVANPLAPDTCWVKPPGMPFPTQAACVRKEPAGNPDGLVPGQDYHYYPVVGDGGRFPLKCTDESKDCGQSAAGQRRCGNIAKVVGSETIPSGDDDPACMATVLDHFTSSFNWAPNNFGAILLRPQWYLVNHSVITDVQNAGLSFITGGDYTRSSAINGYWSLAEHSVFIGNTQKPADNHFAENVGPFNPSTYADLKCDAQATNFCMNRKQQWSINFDNWSVEQRLFNIYDGPFSQAENAYLDVSTSVLDESKCNVGERKLDCLRRYYPIAFGPVFGLMKTQTVTASAETTLAGQGGFQCFLPNAAIAWKQPNGFYYPPAFHSDELFFDKVDIRHFVIEPLFSGTGYQTDNAAVEKVYCKRTETNIFNNFSDVDRQTVLNDDDGSLTGLVHTLSVNKQSPFFTAPYETDECASQTGVTSVTPPPPAPTATAKTSPYDYVTTVLLPGCTQKAPAVTNQPLTLCGCDVNGENCTEWAKTCSDGTCAGVKLYRQLKVALGEDPPFIRMAGQSTWQRSTLSADHGVYFIDTTYTQAQQVADGFDPNKPGPVPEKGKINVFKAGEDYYVFFIFAQDTTKQDYKTYVGGTDLKKGTATLQGCSGTPAMPAPYLVRANIATAPSKVTKPVGTFPGTWCYNETGTEPGVLTVHLDMTAYAAELSPLPNPTYNSQCQPKTFCTATGSSCGCAPGNPMYSSAKKDCDNICGKWAVKDLDCPSAGCIGFGFTLPTPFNLPVSSARPPAQCFLSSDPNWTLYPGNNGFKPMTAIAGGKIPGTQCTYAPNAFTGNGKFCP